MNNIVQLHDNFQTRHVQVSDDPAKELVRRLELWASVPPSRGLDLRAGIVPYRTIQDAAGELSVLRSKHPIAALLVRLFRAALGHGGGNNG